MKLNAYPVQLLNDFSKSQHINSKPRFFLIFFFNIFLCFGARRPQEEKGQGRSGVPDDAQGWTAGHGVQGSGAVGRQGAVGEQDRAHAGHPGGVQEAVQRRRRPRRLVQDHVRDRQAAGDDALASVRRARRRRHVRQLRQQRTVRQEHRPAGRGAVPAAGRVQGPRQRHRRRWRRWRRRSHGDVFRGLVAVRRVRRRATRFGSEGRSALKTGWISGPRDHRPIPSRLTPPQPPTSQCQLEK